MVEIPGRVAISVSEERYGVVCSKGTSEDSSKDYDNDGNERAWVSFGGFTVTVCMNVSMHESGTKTYE